MPIVLASTNAMTKLVAGQQNKGHLSPKFTYIENIENLKLRLGG
jgi:hypothetical protein